MAYQVIKVRDVPFALGLQLTIDKALKEAHVDYVVAPYEADAQLAFLERKGYVDAILSEDSDLVVFGCAVILFKLDPAGAVVEYRRDRLTMCNEYRFDDWTDDRLRQCARSLRLVTTD
jgi:exonuclease-1